MVKTMTDWSALNRLKGKTVEETPPTPPPVPSSEDAAAREVMAFFAKPGGNVGGKGRPAAVVPHGGTSERIAKAAAVAAAEAVLRTELEAVKCELEAAKAAKAEAEGRADKCAKAAEEAAQRAEAAERKAEAAERSLAEARAAAEEVAKMQAGMDRANGECSRLKEALKQAEEKLQEQERQNAEREQMHAAGIIEMPPDFAEAFEGELREIVVSALKDALNASINGDRQRRSTVLGAVLEANPATGELARRRAALKQLMKDNGCHTDPKALEALGFKLVSGRTHWKLEYADVRMTLAKTPSDFRANLNSAAEMGNRCF